jgi:hypothetical protein
MYWQKHSLQRSNCFRWYASSEKGEEQMSSAESSICCNSSRWSGSSTISWVSSSMAASISIVSVYRSSNRVSISRLHRSQQYRITVILPEQKVKRNSMPLILHPIREPPQLFCQISGLPEPRRYNGFHCPGSMLAVTISTCP